MIWESDLQSNLHFFGGGGSFYAMTRNLRKFTDSPMETYLVVKGIAGGIWFMTHPFTFVSVAQSWSELEILGAWFPLGAATFWGIVRLIAGILHLFGILFGIRRLRLFACLFSSFYYFLVASGMLFSNFNDPTLAEYFILSVGAAWMFFLIFLKMEDREGNPFVIDTR